MELTTFPLSSTAMAKAMQSCSLAVELRFSRLGHRALVEDDHDGVIRADSAKPGDEIFHTLGRLNAGRTFRNAARDELIANLRVLRLIRPERARRRDALGKLCLPPLWQSDPELGLVDAV